MNKKMFDVLPGSAEIQVRSNEKNNQPLIA